ncbi:MAG: AAA family ATPase [Pyrinomonadaceae bacterium]|nr:AAA family ATPase [Pyrinomonadaceae bacterium]
MMPLENTTEFVDNVLALLQSEGWIVKPATMGTKSHDIELSKNGVNVAVQARNHKAKVHVGQVEKFVDFLSQPTSKHFSHGFFISASGFSQSVYTYLRSEEVSDLRLGTLVQDKIVWDDENFIEPPERSKVTYIGVFTCKGGVGKTTVSAHLAGGFALNGYDSVLVDLDRQSNLRKLLGDGVYLPATNGNLGSTITVLNYDEWDESAYPDTKIVICDCNPEIDANPVEFIRKFDYCIVPTTLNPLGINKNADVIKRTFSAIRSENKSAELFVLINNFYTDESVRNEVLSEMLKENFKPMTDEDDKCHYIDPNDVSIRFSKQLMYWGYHLVDNSRPQLAFRAFGGKSYPRVDFLKLVDYLEAHTEIKEAKLSQTVA